MALTMYALIRVADNVKITEARETTHLNNGTEAWVPIEYHDKPQDLPATKIAEKTEELVGAKWVKSWRVRNKTAAERRTDRLQQINQEEADLRLGVLDALETILGDDAAAKTALLEKLQDLKTRRNAETQ